MTDTNKTSTDVELVKHTIEHGDQQAFGELYDRYCSRVYNKCISFTKSQAEAEDLTHDIFLKAFLKMSTFKQNCSFYTWLYSITYHACIDYSRKHSSDNQDMVMAPEDVEKQRVTTYYEETEEDIEQIKAEYLKKVLATLEAPEKIILLMKYQDDMSIAEMQDVLGIGEGAVKMRLLRAKKRALAIYKQLTKNL